MKNYIINKNTLAILPDELNNSIIYEDTMSFRIQDKPNSIIRKNCRLNGSTLSFNQKKTELLTGDSYKAPILIGNSNLIFFPTSSPRLNKVAWINLFNVDRAYFDNKNNNTIITFYNGTKVKIDSSLYIINNQILKASRLEHKLLKINASNS